MFGEGKGKILMQGRIEVTKVRRERDEKLKEGGMFHL